MKYIDLHNWPDVKPDEKEYKESIISFLCDHFCHEDLTFILTHDKHNIPVEGKNVVVLLSGNEASVNPSYHNKVGLVYTDFWNPTMSENVFHIPMGFNERSVGRFLNKYENKQIPTNERQIDICFIGALHNGNTQRKVMYEKLLEMKDMYNIVFVDTGTFFYNNNRQEIEKQIDRYFNVLANTKISLCPGGCLSMQDKSKYFSGWESYRFTESVQSGCVILANYDWSKWYKLPSVFTIDNWQNLNKSTIDKILNKDLNKIQSESTQEYRKSISRYRVLESMIQDIEKLLLK